MSDKIFGEPVHMPPTPRVDARAGRGFTFSPNAELVFADFARELEREQEQIVSMDNAAMDKMQAMIREQSERLVEVCSYAEQLKSERAAMKARADGVIANLADELTVLRASLEEMTPSLPPADAPCHKGICSQAACGYCGRVMRARAALSKNTTPTEERK